MRGHSLTRLGIVEGVWPAGNTRVERWWERTLEEPFARGERVQEERVQEERVQVGYEECRNDENSFRV